MRRIHSVDMIHGAVLPQVIRFSVPLMLTGVLQLIYNAADIVVVGRFVGSEALAAVGSTGSMCGLLLDLFMGLSVGASVIVAQYFGARSDRDVSESVHTSMLLSLIAGLISAALGMVFSRQLLSLMGTPAEVIDLAVVYLFAYFLGVPASMVFNFGAAILRAVGDARRPLIYLMVSGAVNVMLNLFFVIACGLGVLGVGLATALSQLLAAVMVVACLMRENTAIRFVPRRMRFTPDKLSAIVRVGLPAGLQGMVFSISNVLIQSSINSFGAIAVAGNSAAGNIEGFIHIPMTALYQAAITFAGQNVGAKRTDRLARVTAVCLGSVTVVGIVMGIVVFFLRDGLVGLYSGDPEVVAMGALRLATMALPYFLCGLMDVITGILRGMGYSILPMVTTVVGVCGLRVVWIFTVFRAVRQLPVLYISYPISWALAFAVQLTMFIVLYRKLKRNTAAEV
ncbi:MAG: MATE family efflux transporter [Clostridia bacterium]|nr:MATE family efflux transporter [Clostridia bacterium]